MFTQFLLFTSASWFLGSLITVPALLLLYHYRKKAWQLGVEDIMLIGFLVFFWISFAFRQQPLGYQEFIGYSLGPLIYLIAKKIDLSDLAAKHHRTIALVLSSTGAAFSLAGIYWFVFSNNARLSSLFKGFEPYLTYPNTFAFALLLALPLNLYLFLETKTKRKLMAATFLWLNLVAFFLTFSRGAYLAAIGTIIVSIVLGYFLKPKFKSPLQVFKRNGIKVVFIFLMALIGGFLVNELHREVQPPDLAQQVPLTEDLFERISDQGVSADQSTDERVQFWLGSLKLIRDYPLFGIGSSGFEIQYPKYQTELLALSNHPHNIWLKLASENGLPAALLFLAFIAILFYKNLTYLTHHKLKQENFWWRFTLLATFIATNLHMLVDYNLGAVGVWFLWWMLIGLLASKGEVEIESDQTFNYMVAVILVVITGISLWHISQYRLIKEANHELLANKDESQAQLLLAKSNHSLFEPLRVEVMGTLGRKYFAPYLAYYTQKYPNWAQVHVAYARVAAANNNPQIAVEHYQKALALNSQNDLRWHYEYLKVLDRANGPAAVAALADQYYQLVTVYTQKLRYNEHHTVVTQNPTAINNIIQLYLDLLPPNQLNRWQQLDQVFQDVWQLERNKFNLLFNYQV